MIYYGKKNQYQSLAQCFEPPFSFLLGIRYIRQLLTDSVLLQKKTFKKLQELTWGVKRKLSAAMKYQS